MRNRPLTIAIEDGELVIRLGVETLAVVANYCPLMRQQFEGGDPPKILDVDLLANDVARELQREEEDGTTPVHGVIDAAILEAYEQGSAAFEES